MTSTSPPENLPTGDRALRALADIVGDSRPRVPEDGVDPAIPVAATVIIARDGRDGIEVLLIERPDRGSFAGAWVFPGGKLEDADREGVETEQDAARRAGVRETHEETGLIVSERALVTLSVWDPPPGLPLRIRTWFFVTPASGGEIVLQEQEAVRAEWMAPADALARHGRAELTLYPPTWVTLHGLGAAASVDALVAATRLSGPRSFETVARRIDSGPVLLWGEDAEYAEPGDGASRHRLEVGALPWIYTRAD